MFMSLAIAGVLTLPALSVQVPEADWPEPSLLNTTAGSQKSFPERASEPLKLTVTSVLFQPASFGAGEIDAAAVGEVLSMLIPLAVAREHSHYQLHRLHVPDVD